MSPEEIQRDCPQLPRLVADWQEGLVSSGSNDFGALQTLLRTHHSARAYFAEAMHIDAELRWRMGSLPKVGRAVASGNDGSIQPVASILVDGLSFQHDQGFNTIFERVQHSEPHAQLWLRLYPALRACAVVCFRASRDAEAIVLAICDDLSQLPSGDIAHASAAEFREAVANATLANFANRLSHADSPQTYYAWRSVVEVCLNAAIGFDPCTLYKAVESVVPRQLPAAVVRLLSMHYLLGKTPSEISTALGVPKQTVSLQLAAARIAIWKACLGEKFVAGSLPNRKRLVALVSFIDCFSGQMQFGDSNASSGRSWNNLLTWLKSDELHARCFLTFAISNDLLHQQVTLATLLEELNNRRDPQFRRVITELVRQIERTPPATYDPVIPLAVESGRRGIRRVAGWFGAAAAALIVAATAITWNTHDPTEPHGERLANNGIASATDDARPPSESAPSESAGPPKPVVVATVESVLGNGDKSPTLTAGANVVSDQLIELTEGIMQLSTTTESELVLEGPIAVTLDEQGTVWMEHGKLVGRNNSGGDALVVQTPNATVVDVGTEFGVDATVDHATSVAVYEGAVQVAGKKDGSGQASDDLMVIEANHQIEVAGNAPQQATPLVHQREFIRPDEVELRVDEQRGSAEAAEQVAFYEVLRVDGLLAYQSFQSESLGEELSLGFAEPCIRPAGTAKCGADLSAKDGASRSLSLTNGDTVFLDMDTTDRSAFFQTGLVDEQGMLGNKPGEIWIYWRSKIDLHNGVAPDWVGVSLMRDDTRDTAEPLFIGKPWGFHSFGIQSYGDANARQELDIAAQTPGVQPKTFDTQLHRWIVRFECEGNGKATASIWCDVDLSQLATIAPHAQEQYQDLTFDRLRFEVSPGGARCDSRIDDIVIATSQEALATVLQIASREVR